MTIVKTPADYPKAWTPWETAGMPPTENDVEILMRDSRTAVGRGRTFWWGRDGKQRSIDWTHEIIAYREVSPNARARGEQFAIPTLVVADFFYLP